jgi:hypothetical protein
MKSYAHLFLFLLVLISLTPFCSTAVAAGGKTEQQEASPSYTNKDLEQYRPPADESPAQGSVRPPADHRSDKRQRSEAAADKKEQEYWCKKTRQIKKGLAIAQDEVNEHTARRNELSAAKAQTTGKKMAGLEKQYNKADRDLKAAGKRLRERQETLAELEDDAHRNNVPPGWLRCQFE